MAHYESNGGIWDKGEKPVCSECGKKAKWDTAYSGLQLCNRIKCIVAHVRACSDPIEYVKDDKHGGC